MHATWSSEAFTVTSVTDYLSAKKRYGEDTDVSPNPIFNYDVRYRYRQFSQELRANGELDDLRWVAGLYYLDYRSTDGTATDVTEPFGLGLADFTLETRSPSVFAQLEYDLSSRLTLIAGARYTYDDKSFDYQYECVNCPQSLHYVAPDFAEADKSFDIGTGKLEIDYKVVPGTMLYASVNRGAKGGGWSAPTTGFVDPADLPYDQEKLTSYELGLKSTFWDGAARLNAATFYYDYGNYQGFFVVGATQVVENIDATVKGGEVELALLPLRGLNLQLGVSHLQTKAENVPTPAGLLLTTYLPQAPRWSINAVAHYEWPFLSGHMAIEADMKWSSRQYLELMNAPVDRQPSYAVSNARVSFSTADEKWEVSAFVKNLADERFRVYNLDMSGFIGISEGVYAPPRLYGASVRYNF